MSMSTLSLPLSTISIDRASHSSGTVTVQISGVELTAASRVFTVKAQGRPDRRRYTQRQEERMGTFSRRLRCTAAAILCLAAGQACAAGGDFLDAIEYYYPSLDH